MVSRLHTQHCVGLSCKPVASCSTSACLTGWRSRTSVTNNKKRGLKTAFEWKEVGKQHGEVNEVEPSDDAATTKMKNQSKQHRKAAVLILNIKPQLHLTNNTYFETRKIHHFVIPSNCKKICSINYKTNCVVLHVYKCQRKQSKVSSKTESPKWCQQWCDWLHEERNDKWRVTAAVTSDQLGHFVPERDGEENYRDCRGTKSWAQKHTST